MKRFADQITSPAARAVAAAALLATLAFASPAIAAPAPMHAAKASKSKVDRVEERITMLHAKLAITPAQEDLWKNLTQVMRDNAKTMEALAKARTDNATTMTAVDDLKSYAELAEAHAAGLKNFVPAFEPLYASMSDTQKTNANTIFRGHGRSHKAGKMMSKRHGSASPAASTK